MDTNIENNKANVAREGRVGALILGIVVGIVLVIVGIFKAIF